MSLNGVITGVEIDFFIFYSALYGKISAESLIVVGFVAAKMKIAVSGDAIVTKFMQQKQ
jgi:hypothetical protein